jgi:hypothetical protein
MHKIRLRNGFCEDAAALFMTRSLGRVWLIGGKCDCGPSNARGIKIQLMGIDLAEPWARSSRLQQSMTRCSMNERVDAIGDENRKRQYQRGCTAKRDNDFGSKAQDRPLAGDIE